MEDTVVICYTSVDIFHINVKVQIHESNVWC